MGGSILCFRHGPDTVVTGHSGLQLFWRLKFNAVRCRPQCRLISARSIETFTYSGRSKKVTSLSTNVNSAIKIAVYTVLATLTFAINYSQIKCE